MVSGSVLSAPAGGNYVDASPSYFDIMNGVTIASKINAFDPESRIVVMIRNPIERALSHFHHYKAVNKIDAIQDMTPDEFFSRDFERAMSGTLQVDLYLQQTLNFSFYYRKALMWKYVFGKRLLLVENASLSRQPRETMERVFRWSSPTEVVRRYV